MKPKFLFTLGGDLGTQTISEPEGWAKIIFNLERDLTYWSLIENFEVPLIFYGIAEAKDGGYTYLKSAILNGIDTTVLLEIQISFDEGQSYELCFDGRIDISTAKEIVYRSKIEAAIVRNDLWAVFMAKKSTPVDLLSPTDIYGNTRLPIPWQEINLPSQKIYRRYEADLSVGIQGWSVDEDSALNGKYFQIDWDEEILDEIKDKFNLPTAVNPDQPVNIFEMAEDGDYYFYFRYEASLWHRALSGTYPSCSTVDTLSACETFIDFYFKLNDEPEEIFSYNTFGPGADKSTVFEFAGPHTLKKGDQIFIYAKLKSDMGDFHNLYSIVFYGKDNSNIEMSLFPIFLFGTCTYNVTYTVTENISISAPSGVSNPTFVSITANTTYIDTQANTILLHDAGLSICDRILGKDDSFYSEFLGGANSAIHYNSNGCGYLNAITRGVNIRGYTFTEKPFTLSWDDYWNGANPLLNLGLGYENSEEFLNPSFAGTLNPWLQHGDPSFRETWAWISNGEIRSYGLLHGDNFRDSYYLYQTGPNGLWAADDYSIHFIGRNDSTGADANTLYCQIYASNDGFVTPILQISSANIPLGDFNFSLAFNLAAPYTGLGFVFAIGAPGNVANVAVYSVKMSSVIRVENKSAFFNAAPSVYLTAINDIQIEFDLNLFTKTIEIGFEQWASESASGLDDPQTKHIYNLRYQLFGKDEKQLSKFVAASLTIEQGRRLTKLQSNDWRFDENVFVITLEEQDSDVIPQTSPPTITQQPELFGSGITGLNNPETRYNVRHTPARMLERWKDFYSGQMQDYLADFFKYASGEGNVLMNWTGDGCDSGSMTENQNQGISSNYLFLPVVYSFVHPLTWDDYATIRDNRKNAISISWILSGVTYTKIAFIKKLGYDINKSKGTFEVWIRS